MGAYDARSANPQPTPMESGLSVVAKEGREASKCEGRPIGNTRTIDIAAAALARTHVVVD